MSINKQNDGTTKISISKRIIKKIFKKIRKFFLHIVYFFKRDAKCIPKKYRKEWDARAAERKAKREDKKNSYKEEKARKDNEKLLKKYGLWEYVYGEHARYSPYKDAKAAA